MKLTLSMKIALYVGILVVFISLGLGIAADRFAADAVLTGAEETLVLLAEEGATYINSVILGNFDVLETIANKQEIRSMDWGQQRPALEAEMARLSRVGYLGLGVVFPDGTTLYNDGSEAALGDQDYVKKAFAGETNISNVLISRVTNSAVLIYAAPIYNSNNQIAGVLIARRPGDALSDITDRTGFGDNGFGFILGTDGTFYAQPNRELVMNQVNVLKEIEDNGIYADLGRDFATLGQGNTGVMNYAVEGVNSYVGAAPIPTTGWTFAVGALEKDVLSGLSALRKAIVSGALAFVVIGIAVALFVGRLISKPIVRASEFAVNMATGDLSKHIDEKYLKLTDEVGDLARAFETLGNSFRETITEIQNSAQDLAASSQQMSATAESSSANMEEVSASTEEISASLEEVSAAAQQISASSQQMNASASELVKSMVSGNQTAKKTEQNATAIQAEVERSQQRATSIYNELDAKMKEGIEKAKIVNEISNMANQIAAIADQTNLLALNAAIEAARAGEQGRGFAVVAEEVRKLASDSTDTVETIKNLTEQVQRNIEGLIQDANALLKFVSSDVTEDYRKFLDTAGQYRSDAVNFNAITSEAAQMGEQVLSAVEEVTRSITEVTMTINQSAEGAGQIARGTEETSRSMMDINDASDKLAKMSEELTKLVSHFRV